MEINGMVKGINQSLGVNSTNTQTHTQMQEKPATRSLDSSAQEKLAEEITELSTDQLHKLINEQTSIDYDKVEQIKTAISHGEYPLNASKISEAFIKLEADLR